MNEINYFGPEVVVHVEAWSTVNGFVNQCKILDDCCSGCGGRTGYMNNDRDNLRG